MKAIQHIGYGEILKVLRLQKLTYFPSKDLGLIKTFASVDNPLGIINVNGRLMHNKNIPFQQREVITLVI